MQCKRYKTKMKLNEGGGDGDDRDVFVSDKE